MTTICRRCAEEYYILEYVLDRGETGLCSVCKTYNDVYDVSKLVLSKIKLGPYYHMSLRLFYMRINSEEQAIEIFYKDKDDKDTSFLVRTIEELLQVDAGIPLRFFSRFTVGSTRMAHILGWY